MSKKAPFFAQFKFLSPSPSRLAACETIMEDELKRAMQRRGGSGKAAKTKRREAKAAAAAAAEEAAEEAAEAAAEDGPIRLALNLDDGCIADLELLRSSNTEAVAEFCAIALKFIVAGANTKLFAGAAAAMGVGADVVEGSVAALASVFVDSTKAKLNTSQIARLFRNLEFSSEQATIVADFADANLETIQDSVASASLAVAAYSDLHWRLDVELASRMAHNKVQPSFLLRLDTKEGVSSRVQERFLQADYANLKHLVEQLESALAEDSSVHSQRVKRYIR